ncbi:MAG: hypothetical protein ACXWQO_09250 [Bdellovibrionota bacterium]
MKFLAGSLLLCFVFAASSCTKKEAPSADAAPAASEQVEGTSTPPSDNTPENSPDEMQKKENKDTPAE